jgi:hypothetical protein
MVPVNSFKGQFNTDRLKKKTITEMMCGFGIFLWRLKDPGRRQTRFSTIPPDIVFTIPSLFLPLSEVKRFVTLQPVCNFAAGLYG